MNRRRELLSLMVAMALVTLGVAGCAEGQLQDNQTDDNQPNQVANQDAGPDAEEDADGGNGTDPKSAQHNEAHQLCAAADETSDGQVRGLHCFAPHDVSGFEATDGERTWKPGALQVAAD